MAALKGKRVIVNEELSGKAAFENLSVSREDLLQIFAALRRELSLLVGETAEEVARYCDALGFDFNTFLFALQVFEELGLIAFGDGRLTVYRGVKAELNTSKTYRKVCFLQEQ